MRARTALLTPTAQQRLPLATRRRRRGASQRRRRRLCTAASRRCRAAVRRCRPPVSGYFACPLPMACSRRSSLLGNTSIHGGHDPRALGVLPLVRCPLHVRIASEAHDAVEADCIAVVVVVPARQQDRRSRRPACPSAADRQSDGGFCVTLVAHWSSGRRLPAAVAAAAASAATFSATSRIPHLEIGSMTHVRKRTTCWWRFR